MQSYIRHALIVAAGLVCLLAGPAIAHSYEFHMLGGMVVKGDLTEFRGGVFYIETQFGDMTINAANLDYIIVEPEDAAGSGDVHEGVLEFGLPPTANDWSPEKVDMPQAVEGYSLNEEGTVHPGTFRGDLDVDAPGTLEGYSLQGEDLPETLRITADDYAGVVLDMEDAEMPQALEGYSLQGEELPEEFRITADDYAGVVLDMEDVEMPQALEGYSLQEEELPEALRITADDYAGVVLDREGAEMPDPLAGYSLLQNEEAAQSYPGRFMPKPGTDGVQEVE